MGSGLARAVDVSSNRKLGVASSTYAAQNSCPASCPFRNAGCYAEYGLTGIHTRKMNAVDPTASILEVAHAEAEEITNKISGRFDLRLHVVGDCSSDEAAQIVSGAALEVLRKNRKAWTYTHAWKQVSRVSWGGVNTLASCESPEQVIEARDKGWATAMVVPAFASDRVYLDGSVKVLPCPNQTRGVTCSDCGLCKREGLLRDKGLTIGFTPHSSGFKTVRRIVDGNRKLIQIGG